MQQNWLSRLADFRFILRFMSALRLLLMVGNALLFAWTIWPQSHLPVVESGASGAVSRAAYHRRTVRRKPTWRTELVSDRYKNAQRQFEEVCRDLGRIDTAFRFWE